jgi:NTE family protein
MHKMGYRLGHREVSQSPDEERRIVENVLIMQGGGSLGAFACGVYKALVKKKIRIDIAAGTSIGAVNAAIIVGSKSGHPEKDLEEFWLEIAESNYHFIPDMFIPEYSDNAIGYTTKKISSASANAAVFGVPKMFVPRWFQWKSNKYTVERDVLKEGKHQSYFLPYPYFDTTSWTYIYDHSLLATTLDKYIDYKKLGPNGTRESQKVHHLVMTAVDVLTAKPLIFDSTRMRINARHILASSGYPIYGFPWIRLKKEENDNYDDDAKHPTFTYAWDGSLLSNTPIREVLSVSPRNDKNIFVVENYPRKVKELPSNIAEVQSRAKDILFSDKDMGTIRMSRLITRQIQLINRLYSIFETGWAANQSKLDPNEVKELKSEYDKLIRNRGAQILSVNRIIRSAIDSPTILQNADFSSTTVKELIAQGERKTYDELNYCEEANYDFNI